MANNGVNKATEREKLTEMISVVFTPTQLKAVEETAVQQDRKVGNLIRWITIEYLKSINKLSPNTPDEVDDGDE